MSMPDRGDSYRLEYLGSVMLSHASTGLGMLQKPLKELYFRYRQPGGNKRAQERHLVMTGRGMTMTYRDNPAMPPMELFYDMPDIVFWDAVQFVTVKGHDKKYRGAFEPLDNDHSRNKDNLFSQLEKKYNFLIQMKHPPLFTCALRRTMGVKAIDVHAFVCSSDEEALSIMRALETLQYYYNTDAEQGSGVFEYKPFIQNRTPVGSLRSQTGLQASTPDLRFTPQAHPAMSEITSAFPAPIATPDRPARPPRDTIREPPNPNRPQVYRLTQEDFSSSQPNLSPGSILFDPAREEEEAANQSLRRRYNPPEPAMGNDNTYEYIRHIEQEKPVSAHPVRNPGSVYTTTLATRAQQSPNSPDPRSYDSMTRDMYIGDSTIQSRGPQYSRDYHVNTNQGPTHYGGHGQQDQNNTYDTRLPHAQAGGNHDHQSRDQLFRSNGPMHSPTSPSSPPPEPPPKPVAKVQPRKIQGVKVLPNMPISPVKEHAHSSSGESSARSSALYEDGDSRRNSALSGSDSSSHHRSEYYDNTGAWPSQQQKSGGQIANWQLNRGVDSGRQSGSIRPSPEEERYRTTDQEKVQRSRKEAEIASVFQNVHIEDRTWKPSRMSDFQQGLGYLP